MNQNARFSIFGTAATLRVLTSALGGFFAVFGGINRRSEDPVRVMSALTPTLSPRREFPGQVRALRPVTVGRCLRWIPTTCAYGYWAGRAVRRPGRALIRLPPFPLSLDSRQKVPGGPEAVEPGKRRHTFPPSPGGGGWGEGERLSNSPPAPARSLRRIKEKRFGQHDH